MELEPLEGVKGSAGIQKEKTAAVTPAIATTDPTIRAIAERVGAKIAAEADISADAKAQAQEAHAVITKTPQQLWFPMAPLPTDMCRVSPFFPLAKRDLTERSYIKDMVITDGAWGRIKYSGPQLSTYEEDILMAVLALLDGAGRRTITEHEESRTYKYTGPLLPVLRYAGLSGGKANYDFAKRALKLMLTTAIELEIFKRDSRGKRKLSKWQVTNLLTMASWSEDKKQIEITINPYFYEMYIAGNITLIDVLRRSKIKSPVAKSLYRFILSQQDQEWKGHFMTLSTALNLNPEIPTRKQKDRIKQAINALKTHKILLKESGFIKVSGDIVRLIKHPSTTIRRKLLK
jgi:hypothetical protein